LGLGLERRSLRHGPREQHALVLQAEIVVQVAREMLLHAEEELLRVLLLLRPLGRDRDVAGRLRRRLEIAFFLVFLENQRDSFVIFVALVTFVIRRRPCQFTSPINCLIGFTKRKSRMPAPMANSPTAPNRLGSAQDS